MECPHCGGTLPSISCPECGGETPPESLFCCRCGKSIKREKRAIDLSERIACSDGNCIGTIDEEGICSICKKPYTGEAA